MYYLKKGLKMYKKGVGHVFDPCGMYKGSDPIIEASLYKGIQDIRICMVGLSLGGD